MTRIFDLLVEFWDRIRTLFGLNRLSRKGRGDDLARRGTIRRIIYFLRPLIVLLVIFYLGTMIWRFSWVRGETLDYPQSVLTQVQGIASGEETEPESGDQSIKTCAPSQIVAMQAALLNLNVKQNDWTPASPQYKFGFFGLVDWASTPWFDNKASFQIGVHNAVRRTGLELTDTLGRERGTSAADKDLEAARGKLQVDMATWNINLFDARLPLVATSASSAYNDAMGLYQSYNARLAACDALFDARADNLRQYLDRVTKDLGSIIDQIARRSQGRNYDVASHSFVDGEGNDYGWFDMRADNLFNNARGRMYAYHGLLQAARIDFAEVIEKRDLTDVWDRMEAHTAEAAVLSPWIVSNGREDGFLMPDHLSVMAENMLRARANMVELRDILAR
ncbi:MAG: DUF2333 family protein [Pikeienuella sp.]